MIRGLHAMFYSSKAAELRAFFRDKLGFDGTDVEFTQGIEDHGYGFVTHFKVPGDFVVQLYQPKYEK